MNKKTVKRRRADFTGEVSMTCNCITLEKLDKLIKKIEAVYEQKKNYAIKETIASTKKMRKALVEYLNKEEE